MFEQSGEPLLSWSAFIKRVLKTILVTLIGVGLALSIGVFGYHVIAQLSWIDSVLNASMILTGMGPVDPMKTNAAKLFASAYALFSGIVFITSMGVILSPIMHRVVHAFHADGDES